MDTRGFDRAGGQEITSTLHVSRHLDAPAHFFSGGKFIGDLPLDWLMGPACVVDLAKSGIGDYEIYGPEHFERWEKDTGHSIDKGDIVLINTGYHRYYPENWTDLSAVDETKYKVITRPNELNPRTPFANEGNSGSRSRFENHKGCRRRMEPLRGGTGAVR